MINKRLKENFKNLSKNKTTKIRFCLATIALVCLSLILLVISTFTQIKIDFNIPDSNLDEYVKLQYIPQVPIVIFIAALLGRTWGLTTILLYIILGLSPYFPIFALGGGLEYIFQYSFGYIFAYIFAVIFATNPLKKEYSIKKLLLAMIYGVVTIHIIGLVYMTILALIRHEQAEFIQNWIYYQSLSKILYDIIFSTLAVFIAKGCRKIIWLIMG